MDLQLAMILNFYSIVILIINNLEISFSSESEYITISTQNTYIGDLNGNSTTSIKNYISNAYYNSENPPEHVCLVGDATGSIDVNTCLLYTSPSPRDATLSRMPSSA